MSVTSAGPDEAARKITPQALDEVFIARIIRDPQLSLIDCTHETENRPDRTHRIDKHDSYLTASRSLISF